MQTLKEGQRAQGAWRKAKLDARISKSETNSNDPNFNDRNTKEKSD
jgi:hypothetical protein